MGKEEVRPGTPVIFSSRTAGGQSSEALADLFPRIADPNHGERIALNCDGELKGFFDEFPGAFVGVFDRLHVFITVERVGAAMMVNR